MKVAEKINTKRRTLLKSVGAGVGASAILSGSTSAAKGSYTTETYDGRTYTKYIPTGADGSAIPLVVMLHGCTQNPDQFKDETQMNEVAERETFAVIYPDQTTSANIRECWNWFQDQHTTRGSGEAELIAGMAQDVMASHSIDDNRVFVAGLSAGAAMVPNLLVAYPDVFAAGGIHSGLVYDVAENVSQATTAMTQGGPDPQQQGTEAYQAMQSNGVTDTVPTIVFHGTEDYTVYPINGHQATEQATQTNDLAADGTDDDSTDYTPDETTNGQSESFSYTVSEYHDSGGETVVEKWIIDGMAHAWSGGAQGGAYTAPGGPDASQQMWDFFAAHPRNGDDGGDGGNGDNNTPTASASATSNSPAVGESVSFDGSGSVDSDGTIASYDWELGDGATGTGAAVSHSYDSAGEYTATLTVSDDAGATDTDSVVVTVGDEFSGYCGSATNYDHGTAGRAYQDTSTGAYYAVGSDDYLGFPAYTSTLKETSAGYFETVSSC
ncbi:extracellular catalytic domain type 1 short-chain-length polyhydroxyalkanoate depolymerase [Haladaptatus cibarius]|uniref:extracellular catalytic domain type 1 short-chain-length polyhydroxyalkanoate depolymerase n=1 Tax=Haladaptatus cibarius TaxID=453847 RepID=UPI000B2A3B31|nr:PHB depolymerase family esterase [Haladaptatus cibarius]